MVGKLAVTWAGKKIHPPTPSASGAAWANFSVMWRWAGLSARSERGGAAGSALSRP